MVVKLNRFQANQYHAFYMGFISVKSAEENKEYANMTQHPVWIQNSVLMPISALIHTALMKVEVGNHPLKNSRDFLQKDAKSAMSGRRKISSPVFFFFGGYFQG